MSFFDEESGTYRGFDTEQFDDLTMLCMEYKEKPNEQIK